MTLLRKVLGWTLSLLVTFAVGWWLLHKAPITIIESRWEDITPAFYVMGLIITLLFFALRALRFKEILRRISIFQLLGASSSYSLACMIFPGGIGEVSLPLFLRKNHVPIGESLGVAVVTRLFDIVSSALITVVLAVWLGLTNKLSTLVVIVPTAALFIAALLWISPIRTRIVSAFENMKWSSAKRVATEMKSGFALIEGISTMSFVRLSVFTLLIKLLMTVFYFYLVSSIGFKITFLQVSLAMVATSLLLVFPVQGIAGLGSEDMWWTLSFRFIGMPFQQAVISAITCHLMNLLFVFVLGIVPLVRSRVVSLH